MDSVNYLLKINFAILKENDIAFKSKIKIKISNDSTFY